ncbi:type VII secretion system-associated protein [Actinokineospora sp. 24-640]
MDTSGVGDTVDTEDGSPQTWHVLVDPAWLPGSDTDSPPPERVVGGWPLRDGVPGKFRANPAHEPGTDSPSDPIDAVLRLIQRGEAEPGQLRPLLRETVFEVAVHPEGHLLVTGAPNGVPCVVAATARVHQDRTGLAHWHPADLGDLADVFADRVGLLLNPGALAGIRLEADFLIDTARMGEDEVVAIRSAAG